MRKILDRLIIFVIVLFGICLFANELRADSEWKPAWKNKRTNIVYTNILYMIENSQVDDFFEIGLWNDTQIFKIESNNSTIQTYIFNNLIENKTIFQVINN